MTILAPITMLIFLLLIVTLLISIGVFVYRDAPKHGMDPLVWTLISILVPNLIGFIIYLVVRSSNKDTHKCPNCNNTVKNDYLKCPYCGTMLKNTCSNCGKAVQNDWDSCPYCSSQIDKSSNGYSSDYNDINYTYSENKKNGNKGLKVIIGIVITLVVLFFIIIVVNFVSFNSFKNTSNISIMETSSEVPVKVNELLDKGSKATMKSSYGYWDGLKSKHINIKEGETIKVSCSSKVKDGFLKITLYDNHMKFIKAFKTNGEDEYSYKADKDETLKISVEGEGTKGEYSIEIEKID